MKILLSKACLLVVVSSVFVATAMIDKKDLVEKEVDVVIYDEISISQELSKTVDVVDTEDIDKRKQEFIEMVLPLIKKTNEKILEEREFVVNYYDRVHKDENISVEEIDKITAIARRYKITSIEHEDEFLKRVAPIPTSLALTQAALESGWGRSRFVVEANNLFGQWTWSKKEGDGIVPKDREEGKTHKIRIFSTLQDSVDAYALNLNRNTAYEDFREARAEHKDNFNGFLAAETMHNYSEIREEYIVLLKQVMKKNRFLTHDNGVSEEIPLES